MVDGHFLERLSPRQAGRVGQASILGKIRADGDVPRSFRRSGPEAELVSVALRRGIDHRRSEQRARLPRHRRLWQASLESAGRAAASGRALEIRLQVDQVDRALQLYRSAAEDL